MTTVEQTTSTWGADIVGRRVHPTIVQALAPFVPKPRRAPPLDTFPYTLCGVSLECELEYEDGEPGDGWNEPAYPATAYLHTACVGGVNIFELLGDEQRDEIEVAFLAQKEEV